MGTTLPSDQTKTHLDQATDDPKQARSEIASNVDAFNALKTALGSLALLNLGTGFSVQNNSPGTPDTLNVSGFDSGTKLLFPQVSPPSGWTQDTDQDDKVIRVVDGLTSADDGGEIGGTWTISGISGSDHTHSMQGHTHNISHTHTLSTSGNTTGQSGTPISLESGFIRVPGTGGGSIPVATATTGSPSSGSSGGPSTGSTGGASVTTVTSNGSWRPAYLNVIKATKD